MDVQQMHDYFKSLIDKMDSLNYPNFLPEEIDLYLNEEGQDALIKLRYSGRPLAHGQAFEETQKRSDDLRAVLASAEILPNSLSVENKPNSLFFDLPSNYWFAINEEAEVTYLDCNGESTTKRVNVRPISHDDYTKVIRDPFGRPSENQVLRLLYQNKAEIIGRPNITPSKYYLRYIRKAVRISLSLGVDCELADHIHQEVVKQAVLAATRATQPAGNYEGMLREIMKQE
jgi:hypothetical protein